MNATHTPAPWTIAVIDKKLNLKDYLGETVERTIKHGDSIPDFFVVLSPESKEGDNVFTALVGNGPTSEANARLIAACPELLKALKEFIEVFVEVEKGKISTPYDNAYLSAVRIVAKTEGK